ncbi:hypothetical protein [Micromonospora parva]|uniref:hypothetical protein n=1 Tax=Micromonospora parva TaxID=1464048 RepID=UPI003669A6FD
MTGTSRSCPDRRHPGAALVRAGVPAGWVVGNKTGAGGYVAQATTVVVARLRA